MNETKTSKIGNWVKTSNSLRMFVVGFLVLILLIPLAYIKELIRERKSLQNEVITEINENWGSEIILYGPILKIPYYTYSESTIIDSKTKKTQTIREKNTNYAYFFPKELEVSGSIKTELKKRGIYSTSVFKSNVNLKGNFSLPNFNFINDDIRDKDIVWEKTQVVLQTSNLKGLNDEMRISIGNKNLAFQSNFQNQQQHVATTYDTYGNSKKNASYLIETPSFNLKESSKANALAYTLDYNASGSSKFNIIPIGKETKMHLSSNWKDASFKGAFLPYNPNKIKENGFDAYWKVLQMNRPYGQQFKSLPDLYPYSFGVDFFIPVDDYQQNERSAKYGFLMISLTFLLFFLIQTMSKINIHPFQYMMIGLALVVFYTLLISISEHSNFTKAYLTAGTAVIVLITLYSKSILKNWKFPLLIGVSLTALYGFIFVIIQLENYALLVGSIGLFSILAGVMYASRKIEWS